jgi:hypothetical protein
VITDLVLLWTVGIRPVLVHGGGPEINSWLQKLNIEPEFKGGLRVTDGAPLTRHSARWPRCAAGMARGCARRAPLTAACLRHEEGRRPHAAAARATPHTHAAARTNS